MQKYYGKNWLEVVGLLGSNIHKGLLEYDCTLRREAYGDNVINIGNVQGKVEVFKDLLKKKYIYISALISILFLLKGLYILAIINFILLVFNILFKVYYDIKIGNDLELIQNLNKSKVIVLREGVQRAVEASELVRGDIVMLKKGSFICADLRVIKSDGLKVDERNITGEDFLKEKYESKVDGRAVTLGEINNMLFRGSFVKDGSGSGVVVEIGNNTELGKLLAIINKNGNNKHNMLKKIEDITLKSMLCLMLVGLIIYLVLPGGGVKKQEVFMYGVFAIVTICIPIIIILTSKSIKMNFLKEGIDIINFSSFNLINDVKVVFLNKFGTITKSELYFEKMYTNEKIFTNREIDIKDINIKRILDISLLVNNSKYNNDSALSKGDMYEIAYVKYCTEQGIFKSAIDNKNKRKFEIYKDTNKKVITTVNKCEKGYRANSRGTIEGILELCTHILVNGIEREITSKDIEKIKLADLYFSRESLVTEAFAYRSFSYEPSISENVESNLVFVGMVALENLFAEGVTEDIENLMETGVLPIIFTDDNKIVGEMFGRKVGLISSPSEVISGVELKSLSGKELYKVISRTRVFCRLTPDLKNKVIAIFNADGFKVAVEGETLGDLSVVNSAQLSIIKGKASRLLKQCGDLYIRENGLEAFFRVKEESLKIEKSIKNAIKIYSTLVIAEIIALNCYYALADLRLFEVQTIVFMNFILATPMILLVINYGKEEVNKNEPFIRGIAFALLPVISIIFLPEFNEFAMYMILGGMLIVYGLVNCNLSFKTFNGGVKLLLVAIMLYILGGVSIGFINSVSYLKNLVVIIGGIIIIYSVCDLIVTKWQDS